jgi:MFS family permease
VAYFQEHYRLWLAFPRSIKLFYFSDIFFALSQALWSTVFNLHLLEVGFTAEHIGVLQSVSALVMALIAIPVGLVSDRWGPRRFYIFGSLLFGVPFLVMPWLRSFPLLVGVYVLQVCLNTFMMVSESALLAGEVGSEQRTFVFSFMVMNFFIWNTLGVKLAGSLSTWLPAGALSHYQWPLVLAGVTGIISGVIRARLPFRRTVPTGRGLNLRPSRTTLLIGLISLMSGGVFIVMQNFNNVVLAERFHMGAATIATVLTVAGVLSWFGSMFVPWTSRRFGNVRAWVGVVALQGVSLIYMGFAGVAAWFLPGFMIRSVLVSMQNTLFTAFTMDITPEAERSTASSLATVGRNLGAAAAASAYGTAIAAGHYPLPFGLAGLGAIVSALLAQLFFGRRRSEPTAAGA